MATYSRAAFIRAPFEVKIEEIPKPKIKHPNDVLININAVGMCGSDIHLAKGWAKEWRRFGHETGGVVVETGENVKDLQRSQTSGDNHENTS